MSELDHERMWAFARDLLGRVYSALDGDDVLIDGLDAVIELLQADRGLVFLADGDGVMKALVGRRLRRPLAPVEQEEISKTFVRQALDTGAVVRWDALMMQTPTASATSLGIVAALVAPIGPSQRPRGVLYVDFRNRQRVVDERHVELFVAAAAVFGLLVELDARGEQVRGELTEAKNQVIDARRPMSLDELIGFPSLARMREDVRLALGSSAPMLVLGESGTGKTMLAHAIAEAGQRKPVVRVMLGASDDLNTIASELFGHERGAYTGANAKRVGLVELAHGGTLVLDELLNLPPSAQRLLLDFVQFGTFRPLGYEKQQPKRADVRIVAATNGDIKAAIRDGRLREDLYHRLAHFEIEMPPLRARREDIPALAEKFLVHSGRPLSLSLDARRLLVSTSLTWSGNVRQLERIVMRARDRALSRDPEATSLLVEHFDLRELGATAETMPVTERSESVTVASRWQRLQSERARIDEAEKDLLREALDGAKGVVAATARELGIARTTLSSRLDALGLRAPKGE
ncbi:MAG: sigma 54-interacting transcriptional regulator [Labilithrix sp.]